MVCPILGGPSFVARLLPIYSLKSELLFEQINELVKIIHESEGFVFLVMADNHSANVSCFDQFQQKFGGISEFAINHPVKNSVFSFLYLLFDPTHLFKNIKSNWLTEKMKKLRFENFETNEVMMTEWRHLVDI